MDSLVRERDVVPWLSDRSWCHVSLDQTLVVDPKSYFSFQSVLHDWYNKCRGMYYPVCGMVNINDPLRLIEKSSPCGGSRFTIYLSGPLPYIQRHKCVESVVK